ncbi:MAG TPA: radical SAM family heme chaperone HemW [Chlamydiales bacterium]|nr:radical SAM family heme chaperone HemW [Chlamydiales bacterium]
MISVYFHIPFCTKKCPYCHFYVIPDQVRFHDLLREALLLEWERQKPLIQGKTIVSIYFGGGTPSLFGAEAIGEVIRRCGELHETEITVEANPEESTQELFSALKSVGVNRISLGVQSLDDRSLQILERTHNAAKAKEAIFSASAAGIENISIDLMYDLPGQTESSWVYTLDQLNDLPIRHLSLYNLTIEPHTSFHKRKVVQPAPEESLRFLHRALEVFERLGFDRYEISAFAKPGFESRHNLGYWTFRPFLGLGPSAFSYFEGERFQNVPNLQRYYKALKRGESPICFREKLPYPKNVKEQIAVQLRLKEGILLPEVPEEIASSIYSLVDQGLLERNGPRIRLTERGKLFYDSVAAEII